MLRSDPPLENRCQPPPHAPSMSLRVTAWPTTVLPLFSPPNSVFCPNSKFAFGFLFSIYKNMIYCSNNPVLMFIASVILPATQRHCLHASHPPILMENHHAIDSLTFTKVPLIPCKKLIRKVKCRTKAREQQQQTRFVDVAQPTITKEVTTSTADYNPSKQPINYHLLSPLLCLVILQPLSRYRSPLVLGSLTLVSLII